MLKQLFNELSISKTLIFFALLLLAVTITYRNHFGNEFHFDDGHTIENNIFVQDIKNIPLFFKDGTTFSSLPANQVYRPVVSTSFAIDYWLGNGYNLFYFHLSCFLFFLAQGILMFFFSYHLFQISAKNEANFYIAAFTTAWYLLHPVCAETVNYLSARSDLQSTFFLLLGFILYIFSPFCKKTFLYLVPIAIAALAKPTAVMFAPLFFFYVLFFEEKMSLQALFQKSQLTRIWRLVKIMLPPFVFCILLYVFIMKMNPPTWEVGEISRGKYLITQPFVHLYYFSALFLPLKLNADTDWKLLESVVDIRLGIGLLFIVAMIFLAFKFSKTEKTRPISFGILWFFLALIPTSSIIPLSEVLNDHRMFFPFVGLIIAVVWAIALFLQAYKLLGQVIAVLSIFVLFGYGLGTFQRNKVWHTNESLWKDVTIKSPLNGRGWLNYGRALLAKGDFVGAEKAFNQSFQLVPDYPYLHVNYAVLKENTKDYITAEKYYKLAIQNGANYPDMWFHYGLFLNNRGRFKEGIECLNKTLEISNAHPLARIALMNAYHETEQWDKLQTMAQSILKLTPQNKEALAYLEASKTRKGKIEALVANIQIAPTPEKYLNLSLLYYNSSNYAASIEAANQALSLNPNLAEAYNNICSAYTALKEYDKAIEACQKALAIKPNFELAKNNLLLATQYKNELTTKEAQANKNASPENLLELSLTYYNQGLFQKCIETSQKALALKPNYAEAYNNMCVAYIQLKDYDKAIQAANEALRIKPDFELAKNNLKWAKTEQVSR